MNEPPSVSTEAVMDEVRRRLRAELYPQFVAQGAGDDFDSQSVFDEVDRLFEQALAHEHPSALLLPARLLGPWRLAVSLDFASHRRGLAGLVIRFTKKRLVLPVVRWLFEYANQNFRRQQHVNVALMACLQTLAAEQARLRARLAEIEHHQRGPSR
jgi:hypothetical protein